ncbi:MAG: ribosomal-processing cysteine protease Prp [Candidatus Syntrophonatronum acetioxidans]|uniref:Ribosomal processing cysteine protease Prp n=1 Tax=Candidatus Syntrophonatronum acetioxidans TaxID=1795816 RepID=A0A424YG05_9FIRM|nr:MAG: ribosomal-processing cysteine protease Prp [Candidatus Syntrophonatronum acetioxidans]
MVRVRISRDQRGRVNSFKVWGHASFAPHGQDIVCAAVSAVTQTTVIGLKKVLQVKPLLNIREGLLECSVPRNLTRSEGEKVDLLMEVMVAGLEEIKKEYPSYIEVEICDGGEIHEN